MGFLQSLPKLQWIGPEQHNRISRERSPSEKVKASLPTALVATYTGLNGLALTAVDQWRTTAGDLPTRGIVLLWTFWGVMLVFAIIGLIRRRNQQREKDERAILERAERLEQDPSLNLPEVLLTEMKPIQLLVTIVTYALWSLALGGVLRETWPGWNLGLEQLILGAWTTGFIGYALGFGE